MSGYFADAAGRRAYIDALRELADFLDAHPDTPVPSGQEQIQVNTTGSDEEQEQTVREAAVAMGVSPERDYRDFVAAKRFGPIKYFVIAIPQARMDEHNAIQKLGREALEAVSPR